MVVMRRLPLILILFMLVLDIGLPVMRGLSSQSQLEINQGGDLNINSADIRISAGSENLSVSSDIQFQSKGKQPTFSFSISSSQLPLENASDAYAVVGLFKIDNPNGTHSFFAYVPGGFSGIAVLPRRSGSQLQYSMDLTEFIQSAQTSFVSKKSLRLDASEVIVFGSIHLNFVVVGGAQRNANVGFLSGEYKCRCIGASTSIDVTIAAPRSTVTKATVGNSTMLDLSPTQKFTQFYVVTDKPIPVYLEWNTTPETPWYERVPWSWTIGLGVGLASSLAWAILTRLWRRIRNGSPRGR
jgi:hypothetical protein